MHSGRRRLPLGIGMPTHMPTHMLSTDIHLVVVDFDQHMLSTGTTTDIPLVVVDFDQHMPSPLDSTRLNGQSRHVFTLQTSSIYAHTEPVHAVICTHT